MGARNEDLRDAWRARQARFDAATLIFLDESAYSERTTWRKKAWAKKGVPVDTVIGITSRRWSVLPALTLNGLLPGTLVKHGSIKAVDVIQ